MRVNSSGIQAYAAQQARLATTSREEAVVSSAKSSTTTFGIKLGKFGLKYTEHDVSFQAESAGSAALKARQGWEERAFQDSMEVEAERNLAIETASGSRSIVQAGGSGFLRKAAIAAYEKIATGSGPALPGTLLGVV